MLYPEFARWLFAGWLASDIVKTKETEGYWERNWAP
jgi:hypothetical protein